MPLCVLKLFGLGIWRVIQLQIIISKQTIGSRLTIWRTSLLTCIKKQVSGDFFDFHLLKKLGFIGIQD